MKRGEVWTIAGGPDYAGKPRPAVIIQSELFANLNSVTVCLMTTMKRSAPDLMPPIIPSSLNGLFHPTTIMIDKISSIQRSKLGKRLGMLEDKYVAELDRAIIVFLSLAGTER